MVLILSIIFLFSLYSLLMMYFWLSWRAIPEYSLPAETPGIKISVVIPARNEENNIGHLLEALEKQTYPREFFEVIVVDDHSDDGTASVVRNFPSVKLLSLTDQGINSYKKKAIETGIQAASGTLIVTTDADCIPLPSWLSCLASFAGKNQSDFIAAPVSIHCSNRPVEIFQAMDFMVLQGITGAVVYKKALSMCNGANLAYQKEVFSEVGGFSGIDHIASGDDMLLMHKISKQSADKVHYLKSRDAIVTTSALPGWRAFFNQRIRWASKATYYDDKRMLPVLLLVYLFNLSFLVLAIAGFFCAQYWIGLAALWVGKTLIELPFFISVATFFNNKWAIKLFFFFQPLHIIYIIISGLFGQFGTYEWKGRRVK